MKIIVCSDIHDNIWVLAEALKKMPAELPLIFCGDFCAPFTLVQLAEGHSGPIHIVWGNNDGDKWLLTEQASRFDHVFLHGELAEIDIGTIHIAVNHYPNIANGLALSGKYDFVFYGHDHIAFCETLDNGTLLLNPGELMGRLGKCTFSQVDLSLKQVESIHVEKPNT